MARIHPTAIVDGECEIDDDVEIGPWCIVNGPVTLGAGVRLIARVHLEGPVSIGDRTIAYPGVCLGFPAQDVKFTLGDPTAGVVIGRDCILREQVTVHASTNEHTPTRLGDRVFMMVETHLGHDGRIDDDAVLVNNAAVGGHTHIGEKATIGGGSVIHQHARIGRLAFITGGVGMANDVPPYCMAGDRNFLEGINSIGMRRAGIDPVHISTARAAFRDTFREALSIPETLEILYERGKECPPVLEMAQFVDQRNRRPICAGLGRPPPFIAHWLRRLRRGEALPVEDDD